MIDIASYSGVYLDVPHDQRTAATRGNTVGITANADGHHSHGNVLRAAANYQEQACAQQRYYVA